MLARGSRGRLVLWQSWTAPWLSMWPLTSPFAKGLQRLRLISPLSPLSPLAVSTSALLVRRRSSAAGILPTQFQWPRLPILLITLASIGRPMCRSSNLIRRISTNTSFEVATIWSAGKLCLGQEPCTSMVRYHFISFTSPEPCEHLPLSVFGFVHLPSVVALSRQQRLEWGIW